MVNRYVIGTKIVLLGFDSASESHQSPVSSFVRKFAPQSTSMPALPGRNVPNCRPMIDGGTRKCSAGACPPLGSEWGVAESTVPTRHTKSQLRVFTPWCAGPSRDERSLMKACPGLRSGIDRSGSLSFAIRGIPSPIRPPVRHSGEGRNPEGVGRGKATRRWKKLTRRPIFILLCGPRKAMVIPAKAGIQRAWVGPMTHQPSHQPTPPIFTPWCAGARRHGRLVRKHVPDSDPGSFPAPAGDTNHRRPNNDSPGSQERNVALGLVPSQGWGGGHRRHLTLPSTNAPHFHTLVCRCQPAWATAMKTDDTRHSQHHNPHQTRHWYENAPTRLSSAPLNPSIPRSRHSGPSIRHSREGGNPGDAEGRHQ